MAVRFANEPNYELVEKAVWRLAVDVAKSRREQARKGQSDDETPVKNEKRP